MSNCKSERFIKSLKARDDLKKYGNNAALLYALELRFNIEDIHTEASQSLTDGPNDKKCDLVHVNYDRQIGVIAQSYWGKDFGKKEAPSNKAGDLNTAITWLFSNPNDPKLPEILRNAAVQLQDALLSNDDDSTINSLEVWYIHNCYESRNVKDELRKVEGTLQQFLSDPKFGNRNYDIRAIELGLNKLGELYLSQETPILVTDTIEVPISGGYRINSNSWEAFCTAVPLSWVHKIYQKYKRQLFSANVRDYLGSIRSDSNINNGIKKAAEAEQDDFWAYNNGITALVNSFQRSGRSKKLIINGLSIVNGAQSSGAIGSLECSPDKGFIQARFIRCDDDKRIANIIRFNNSQNKVAPADFRSTDRTQQRLRNEFDDDLLPFFYNGGRRGGEGDAILRTRNLIPSDTAAQVLTAFHLRPDVAYNKKKLIWESDHHYSAVFNDSTTALHIVFVYSLHQTIKSRKELLGNQPNLSEQDRAQVSFLSRRGSIYLLQAAISMSLESIVGRSIPNRFNLKFKDKRKSEEELIETWNLILGQCLSFCSTLEGPLDHSLRNARQVKEALDSYSNFINAIKDANKDKFADFSQQIEIE